MGDSSRIRIHVAGPLRVLAPGGEDLTPRGRKACGLLAILALSKDHERPRIVLQDKLWSDRGQEQAAASLRQALTEIRRALGEFRDCLLSDYRAVGLNRDRVEIDLHDALERSRHAGDAADAPVLLEGIDVRDPEFEDWLREQRSAFERELSSSGRDHGRHNAGGIQGAARDDHLATAPTVRRSTLDQPWICISPMPETQFGDEPLVAGILARSIATGVQEIGAVEVSTVVRDTPGIELCVNAKKVDAGMAIRISIRDPHAERILWTGDQVLPRGVGLPVDEPNLQTAANRVVDVVLILLRRLHSGSAENNAFVLGFDAIQRMFRIDANELKVADQLLVSAIEQDPRGIFLAWRAYLRTFLTAEHRIDVKAQAEEARMFARKALEIDPYNSYVLALCSYVHSLLLYEFHAGHELAEQSVRYNPGNPLGVAYLARAKSYLGDFEGGYRLALKARALAGPSPYRYTLDFLGGVGAALSGRYSEAIGIQEIARSLGPNYKAPLRYLLALYLKTGNRGRAKEIFDSLRTNESEFSMRLMRDRSYPTDGLRVAGLLDSVDEEFE